MLGRLCLPVMSLAPNRIRSDITDAWLRAPPRALLASTQAAHAAFCLAPDTARLHQHLSSMPHLKACLPAMSGPPTMKLRAAGQGSSGQCGAGLLSLKTLLCKLVGVCFSMAGGLIAGKEGPFVHSGAGPTNAQLMRPASCLICTLSAAQRESLPAL